MRITSGDNITPLTAQTYHLLLALMEKPMHGYAILRQMEVDSLGIVEMSPGSLYKALDRLEVMNLLKCARIIASERSPHDRKQYKITPFGRQILLSETGRLAQAVRLHKQRQK